MTDPAIIELYALDPEEFVGARNALAKALRSGGDRDTAAHVAKLRRPSVSAWALNQLARDRPAYLEALFGAAAALRAALADPSSADVRTVQRAFRSEIETVVRAALDLVASSGRTASPGLQQSVQATLQAAAVDDGIEAAIRSGVLAADEAAPGFLTGAGPAPKRPRAETTTTARTAAKPTFEERRLAKEREREAAAERTRERARLAELTTNVERLTRRADRLERSAAKAEQAAREQRAEADDARREAVAAQAELDAHPTVSG